MAGTPSKKKPANLVSKGFMQYLSAYGRATKLPLSYTDLLHYGTSVPLYDASDEDTLWETVYYAEHEREEVNLGLRHIYALLKTDGDDAVIDHLEVARVDYCTFGNTKPFRIRIRNKINDNYDHYYVKQADANRLYGLELEHILSPNRITYLIEGKTLIEEHVAGVPGDDFMVDRLNVSSLDKTRIAKEFVKFNERCFVRLLGDMRAYNYVVDITPDIEGNQYRIRAIDFDQQTYEGRKNFYLPQYFKDNNPIIKLGMELMSPESVEQYQLEERALIGFRVKTIGERFGELMDFMRQDVLSPTEKVSALTRDLNLHHQTNRFSDCRGMGDVVAVNLELLLDKEFHRSMPWVA